MEGVVSARISPLCLSVICENHRSSLEKRIRMYYHERVYFCKGGVEGNFPKCMSETYIEQLVKRKPPVGPSIAQTVFAALTVTCLIIGIGLSPFIFLFSIVFGIATYFTHLSADIEYEYLFVERELSIDIIRAKSKRKKIAEFEINRMEVFAPEGSRHLDEYKNRRMSVKDYSSHLNDTNPYVMIYMGDKELQMVVLEGSDALTKCFYNAAPRKVFKD